MRLRSKRISSPGRSFPLVMLFATLFLLSLSLVGCNEDKSSGSAGTTSGFLGKFSVGYNKGYAPEQPIPFNHAQHAGEHKIECLYCHSNPEVSRHSSIPSLNVCMNCHLVVGQSEPIQRLREAYNNNESIEWVKVHMLPDFVHFNHKRHVRKGVACQECHGPVETMKVLYQHSDLSMGWCVNCHRQPEHNAPINCSTCHQ